MVEVIRPDNVQEITKLKMVEVIRPDNVQEITKLEEVVEVIRPDNIQEITKLEKSVEVIRPDHVQEITKLKHEETETLFRPNSPHVELEARVVEQARLNGLEEELAPDVNR